MCGELYPSGAHFGAPAIFLPGLFGSLTALLPEPARLNVCNTSMKNWRDYMTDARAKTVGQSLIVIDLLTQIMLAFGVGLATSLALAGAVLLIAT